jgi:membrane protease YdiL (CAAX protease family)
VTVSFSHRAYAAWHRIPVIIRSPIAGMLISIIGTTPWAILVSANMHLAPDVPWAVIPSLLYLRLYWKYFIRGEGPPMVTKRARSSDARVNPLPPDLWGLTALAGILGLATIGVFQNFLNRVISLPPQPQQTPVHVPTLTFVAWLVTGAVVAGVVEETAFRGYLQRPIEHRHGLVTAILITGLLFGLAHLSHPEVGPALLPYYLVVAAVYGAIASATDSTLPTILIHGGGNILGELVALRSTSPAPHVVSRGSLLVWQTGVTPQFVRNVLVLLALSAATAWTCSVLSARVKELTA